MLCFVAELVHNQRGTCRPLASQKIVIPRNGGRVTEDVRSRPVADREDGASITPWMIAIFAWRQPGNILCTYRIFPAS